MRRPLAIAAVVVSAMLLAGCSGANNQQYGAKQPIKSGAASNSSCKPASRSAVSNLNGRIHDGENIDLADVVRDGGTWYLAASATGEEDVDHGHVGIGIWATTSDPRATRFTGTIVPLNSYAFQAESLPTASPSATAAASASASASAASANFNPNSAAAKRAKKCMITDSSLND
jgi:predicted small secreted protein